MDLSKVTKRGAGALAALLAFTFGASTMLANTTTVSSSTASISCNTATGPGTAATITVKLGTALVAPATLVVTLTGIANGLVVTPSAPQTFDATKNTSGVTYTINNAAYCIGASAGSTPTTLTWTSAGGVGTNVVVTDVVTAAPSLLSASAVTITCTLSAGPTYTPGPAQTISVTSPATGGGTAFTVDNSGNAPPTWLTVSSYAGGTASSTPVTFTVAGTPTGGSPGCGGYSLNSSHTFNLHLTNAPALDKLVSVTLLIVSPSALTAAPASPSITYVKGSGSAGYSDVNVTSSPSGLFFSVNTATLPIWLTVDNVTGTAPKSLRFSSTTACDSLPPGTYTATVYLRVSGYADQPVNVSLLLTNKAPRLSVAEGTTRAISWTLGTATPTPIITAVSSDSPIAYTAVSGGTLAPIIATGQSSGLAYNFGTQIGISFNPLIFAAATPGSVLTGTVTLTWGSPASTIVVTFNITIVSPGSTLTSLAPSTIPTASSGQTFTVILNGTGFVTSTDPTQKTRVGILVNGTGSIQTDTNFSYTVINASNINLTITVPVTTDNNLPFVSGGPVYIGVCNPAGGTCSSPTGMQTLNIATGPIIQAVVSAAAFTQVSAPTLPTVAPYDMVSVFGANFCPGCSTSQILVGAVDQSTFRYPTSLSPDSGTHNLTASFYVHGIGGALIQTAPLLFATNSQINLLVPSALATSVGSGTVDVVVNYSTLTSMPGVETLSAASAIYQINVAATDPGVFTVGADGQGQAAVLNSLTYAPISQTNPAGMRTTGADSDMVSFYVTGLGVPDSSGANTSGGGNSAPGDCITATGTSNNSYESTLQASSGVSPALTNIDGAVIQVALVDSSRYPPCMATNTGGLGSGTATIPQVSVGGVNATAISYAGFVDGAVAGLYQINATLPLAGTSGSHANFIDMNGNAVTYLTAPVQLPVVVTANTVTSQTGVGIWVAPRLKVVAPKGTGLAGTVGVGWIQVNAGPNSNLAIASEGTSPYKYAITTGLFPAGLSLASDGTITGTPAANTSGTYNVTVTATDSANIPVKGTVSFAITVAGGLYVTSSAAGPFTGTFGTSLVSPPTVTATGGTYPYSYAIRGMSNTSVAGATVNGAGVVAVSGATLAGTYPFTVTATDSNAVTGSVTFTETIALLMAHTGPTARMNGSGLDLTTVTATGNNGTLAYTLDATSLSNGLTINSSTGAVNVGTATANTYSITVTATDGTAAPGTSAAGVGSTTFNVTVS